VLELVPDNEHQDPSFLLGREVDICHRVNWKLSPIGTLRPTSPFFCYTLDPLIGRLSCR
jgi:hypothetical protein